MLFVSPAQAGDGLSSRASLSSLCPSLPRELSVQQNCFSPCLCFLFWFFFSPLSLALPQLDRFQIWPSCSDDTLPTTRICTARAVKNVSVFLRNTLPEGALNDVPGRVNSGDTHLLFLRCLLAPSPKQE